MRKYIFSDRFEGMTKAPLRFFKHDKALQFLREATAEYNTLVDLRHWASRRGHRPLPDRELLEYAATCLIAGNLVAGTFGKVTKESSKPSVMKGGGAGVIQKREVAPAPAYRPGERTTPSALIDRQPEKAPEPAPLPAPTLDVKEQVAALLAAAQSGAPFCEQCEKSKAR
jgi:hypothetical protein